MTDHTCHAIGCDTPCPPALLMCAPCWVLVSSRTYRLLRRYHPSRAGRIKGQPPVKWFGAVCHARADVCEARGDYDTAEKQRARGDRLLGKTPEVTRG